MAVTNSNANKYLYGSSYVAPTLGANTPGIVPQVYPGSTGSGSNQNVNTNAYGGYVNPVTGKTNAQVLAESQVLVNQTKQLLGGSSSGGGEVAGVYTYQAPKTITGSVLGGGSYSAMSLPTPPTAATTLSATPGATNFNLSSVLTPGMIADGYSYDSTTGQILTPQQAAEKEPAQLSGMDKMLAKIKGLMPEPVNTTEQYLELEKQAGIKDKKNLVSSLTAQLNDVTAKKNADLLQLRGVGSQEGVTEAVYGGQQAVIEREAAIRTLPLAAQLQAAQGDLQSAQESLDTYSKLLINDAQAQYNYQMKMFESVWNYATAQEKQQLEEMAQEKQNQFTLTRDNLSYARDLAGEAMKNGQSSLAARITTLMQNPSDPQFGDKLANYAGQISGGKTSTVPTIKSINGVDMQWNPRSGMWEKPLTTGIGVGGETTLPLAQSQGNVDTISTLLTDKNIRSAVGPTLLGRLVGRGYDVLTGGRQNFIASVEQIRSNLNLEALIGAKARGATFGALSDQELQVLASSASKIGSWAMKDKNGNVTGYNASEKDFKRELDKINNFAKLDYILKGGIPEDVGAILMTDGKYYTQNSDGTYTQLTN